jgi:hypothetical protein
VMTRIEVERVTDGGLERELWEFSVLRFPEVHLEFFAEQTRKSRRHKWVTSGAVYSRLQMDRHAAGTRLREEPEVPEDVLEEGMDQMRGQLEFKVWRR